MVDFRQRLETGLRILKIDVSADGCERLSVYFSELKKWSRKVNLIAKSTSDEQIIENHFLDSLTILPLLQGARTHLLDIGTGAGFPALVCKAACPELEVTLVEPRLKRVSFLSHVVRTLGLQNVKILACRVEDEEQLPAMHTFTHITARALTELGFLLQMVERFSPSGPQLICMKGPKWQEELAAAAEILARSAYTLDHVQHCILPFTGAERSLLVLKIRDRKTFPA
ncbi:16S rRNA (guanine(527)-N(7))-methyltransferase RsmG [Desulfopila sp. IMCC35006]|uniref:16S rRNA (guanine(527)-N(7))-methyltransferase RsmG n=1 Tax=Desulfopila sp. IMCC35006 TaxID=2569542 RepID=UPI0010ABBE89|nr:16S rRNA (guanine(527)-N(7))-methyltransferase RsmG [Desulfopila sp. IMCC35006]TKB26627.1 16S rRNA (guanine(527)-N(7))-methyltransferase RsmG [Desulfopila sp. IMCC35006]